MMSRTMRVLVVTLALLAGLFLAQAQAALAQPIDDWLALTVITEPPLNVTAGVGFYDIKVKIEAVDYDVEGVVFEYRVPAGVEVLFIELDIKGDGSPGAVSPAGVDSVALDCQVGTSGDPSDPATCHIGDLYSDEYAEIEIEFWVRPEVPHGTILDHDFQVFGTDAFGGAQSMRSPADNGNPEPYQVNNEAHALSGVETRATIWLGKVADPDNTATPGETVTYEIWVRNIGPSTARDVVLLDQFATAVADDMEFLSAEVLGGLGTCDSPGVWSSDVSCHLGDLPPLQTGSPTAEAPQRTIRLTFRLNPDYPSPGDAIENILTVQSSTPGVLWDGDTREAVWVDPYDSELSVVKHASQDIAVAGGVLVYTVEVTNNGPSTAWDVLVRDGFMASDAEFLYASDPMCYPDTPQPGALEIQCLAGDLPPDETYAVDIYLRLSPELECDGLLSNFAAAQWDEDGDRDGRESSSNMAVKQVATACQSDLWIRKFGKPDGEVPAGGELVYYVSVKNLGPSATLPGDVAINDLLASSGSFWLTQIQSSEDYTATCTVGDQALDVDLTWDDGIESENDSMNLDCVLQPSLGVNEEWRLEIVVEADEGQTLNNQADVYLELPAVDPNPDNNHAEVEHDIVAVADLGVDKHDDPDVIMAGETLYYGIEVTNYGPSDAENVVVVDTLPAGVIFQDINDWPGTDDCTVAESFGNTVVTCMLGHLEAPVEEPTTVSFEIEVLLDPAAPAGIELYNSVCVGSEMYDDNNNNNCELERTYVGAVADLGILKLGSPDPVVAGGNATYVIAVHNDGPSVARDVRVFDRIPSDTSYVSDTLPGQGGCEVINSDITFYGLPVMTAGSLRCDLGDMAPGEIEEFSITVKVDADVPPGETRTNRAIVVSLGTPEPMDGEEYEYLENNYSEWENEIRAEADLEVTKTSTPVKVYAGEQKKYTVTVVNHGPSDAESVMVGDELPEGLEYEIDTALCELEDPGVLCNLGTMAAGEERSIDIWARVDPETEPGTVLRNTACAYSQIVGERRAPENGMITPDSDYENNCGTTENLVLGQADLKITKFGKMDGEVRAGDELEYTVIIDNLGPGWAHDVQMRDVLVSSGTFDVVSIESNRDMMCDPAADSLPQTYDKRAALTCVLDEPLETMDVEPAEAGRWILTIVVTADETQDINNVAYAYTSDYDPNQDNNKAYVEHAITDVADLNMSKCVVTSQYEGMYCEDPPVEAVAGETVKYWLYVTNHGPSSAEKIVVVDRLPLGAEVVGVQDNGHEWDCSLAQPAVGDRVLMCGFPNLASDELVSLTYEVKLAADLPAGTVLINGARVTSGTFDDNSANDFDELLVKMIGQPALTLSKESIPAAVDAGEDVEYRLTIGNEGLSTAWDVRLVDKLPEGVRYVAASASNWPGAVCTYWAGSHEVVCTVGHVAPGQTPEIKIATQVDPALDTPTTLTNDAEVTSQGGDSATAQATTDVSSESGLAVTKWGTPAIVLAGEQIKYTVRVTNDGPSAAKEVKISDELPAELDYELGPANCSEVAQDPDKVECDLGTVQPGETVDIELWASVDPTVVTGPGVVEIRNEACVAEDICGTAVNLAKGTETADLKLTKVAAGEVVGDGGVISVEENRVTAGQSLTYVLSVYNDSLWPAWSTTLEDRLPSGIVVTAVTVDPNWHGACWTGTPGDSNDPLVCGLGKLDKYQTVEVTIVARVLSSVAPGTILENDARVYSETTEPSNTFNYAHNLTTVEASADLSVTKVQEPGAVYPGGPIEYTITVANKGPSDALWAVVKDKMPAALEQVTWTCTPYGLSQCPTSGSGDISHRVELPANSRLEYSVKAVLGAGQEAPVNVVQIETPAGVHDSNTWNNVAESSVGVAKAYVPLILRRR